MSTRIHWRVTNITRVRAVFASDPDRYFSTAEVADRLRLPIASVHFHLGNCCLIARGGTWKLGGCAARKVALATERYSRIWGRPATLDMLIQGHS